MSKQRMGMLETTSKRAGKGRARDSGACCFIDQLFPVLPERKIESRGIVAQLVACVPQA